MRDTLEQLVELLDRRAAIAPGPERSGEALRLKGHIEEFLLPRLADLDAPLVVVVLGSTGSGKSSLFNALAGESLSEVGVLRPTTRVV
jgi:predicted GTPase